MVKLKTHYNPALASKNKLADRTFIKVSENSIFTFIDIENVIPTPVLGLPNICINVNLQKTTKLALELFFLGQKHNQLQANFMLCNRFFKTKNSNLYYRHLYIEYYYFH